MTEDEARTKWCHRGDRIPYGDAADDIDPEYIWDQIAACPCLASACMAWRWFDTVSDDGKHTYWKPTSHVARHPSDTEPKPLSERRGYCGLAGRPDQ